MKNSLPQSNDLSLAYTNKTQFIIGICVLIVMIISCSLIGPLTLALPSKSLLIQIIWRYFGSTIISVPLMFGLYAIKGSDMNFKNDFSKNKFKRCLINSLLIFLWNFGFILGCSMTIISHANLCNSSGVFTLILAILCRRQIHKLEFAGYGLFIAGVIFMLLDPFANKVDASSQSNFGVVFFINRSYFMSNL